MKRYFLVGYAYTSGLTGGFCTGHSTLSNNGYPNRAELESALTECNKCELPKNLSIISICEQTEVDQKTFLAINEEA
jgi:hypothetical protein